MCLLERNYITNFVLAMDVIVWAADMGSVLRTSVCTSPTVLEAEVLWSGLEFVQHLLKEHWMPFSKEHIF
jgi:hypothetical protein